MNSLFHTRCLILRIERIADTTCSRDARAKTAGLCPTFEFRAANSDLDLPPEAMLHINIALSGTISRNTRFLPANRGAIYKSDKPLSHQKHTTRSK